MNKRSLLKNSLAEGRWMLFFWLVCFVWVITFCLMFGGNPEEGELSIVGGVPSWVFWGVVLPWVIAAAFSSWFALTRMSDDSLEHAAEEETPSQS